MAKSKILVIGDSCRDIFVYCDSYRLCPEAPVPALHVMSTTENPGMAANVARNIKSLEGSCDLLTNDGWESITKTRYVHYDNNHMFFRVDTQDVIPRIDVGKIDFERHQIIVVSDYNKGFLSESDIEYITRYHPCVILDTKKKLGPWANNVKYIKINNFEYEKSLDTMTPELLSKTIHTHGSRGCIFQNKLYPVKKVEVKDSSGAGDTFLAAFVSKYLHSKRAIPAINFANKCAAKVVSQKGVGVA